MNVCSATNKRPLSGSRVSGGDRPTKSSRHAISVGDNVVLMANVAGKREAVARAIVKQNDGRHNDKTIPCGSGQKMAMVSIKSTTVPAAGTIPLPYVWLGPQEEKPKSIEDAVSWTTPWDIAFMEPLAVATGNVSMDTCSADARRNDVNVQVVVGDGGTKNGAGSDGSTTGHVKMSQGRILNRKIAKSILSGIVNTAVENVLESDN